MDFARPTSPIALAPAGPLQTERAEHDVVAHTPDPARYHDARTFLPIEGTVVPRVGYEGGSRGFDAHSRDRTLTILDRGSDGSTRELPLDLTRVTPELAATAFAAVRGQAGPPRSREEAQAQTQAAYLVAARLAEAPTAASAAAPAYAAPVAAAPPSLPPSPGYAPPPLAAVATGPTPPAGYAPSPGYAPARGFAPAPGGPDPLAAFAGPAPVPAAARPARLVTFQIVGLEAFKLPPVEVHWVYRRPGADGRGGVILFGVDPRHPGARFDPPPEVRDVVAYVHGEATALRLEPLPELSFEDSAGLAVRTYLVTDERPAR